MDGLVRWGYDYRSCLISANQTIEDSLRTYTQKKKKQSCQKFVVPINDIDCSEGRVLPEGERCFSQVSGTGSDFGNGAEDKGVRYGGLGRRHTLTRHNCLPFSPGAPDASTCFSASTSLIKLKRRGGYSAHPRRF